MKKLTLLPALFCLLILSATSCDTGVSSSSTSDPTTLINTVKQGTWKITNFVDSGTDETSHFTGYNFTFGASNAFSATNGTNTYPGTWQVASDDDVNNPSGLKFTIAIASPTDFADLSDGWKVSTYSSTTIYLVDTSGGGSGTDVLVFTKN
ncbi:MAG TPA: hypothetical protein PKN96_10295 [Flavobacterium sp.]|uniref:hypothetical protein n=1 Tax=Flavobacterium sp. TaxID=239 RepID=UPI002BB74119|nr:hypothetical protein [Flavobacterium sp.]HNP33672.1 hypothetical protein [Flavobacterium sp.]